MCTPAPHMMIIARYQSDATHKLSKIQVKERVCVHWKWLMVDGAFFFATTLLNENVYEWRGEHQTTNGYHMYIMWKERWKTKGWPKWNYIQNTSHIQFLYDGVEWLIVYMPMPNTIPLICVVYCAWLSILYYICVWHKVNKVNAAITYIPFAW